MRPEDYATLWGWRIFPVHGIVRGKCTCGKDDCKSPGKHPRTPNGHRDASGDPEVIRRWWTAWPEANVAVATGSPSGMFVIDVDPRHGGFDSLDEFEASRPDGTLPETLTSLTGGGGRHIIFALPPDGTRVPTRNPWLPGIEVKSDGGYVVLPDSTHISGARYRWHKEDAFILQPPADLLQSIRNTATSQSGREELPSSSDILQGIPEGKRDDTIFRWACQLRRRLLNDRKAVEVLVLEAARNAVPPFPEDEAMRKVEQAFRQDHDNGVTQWDYTTDTGFKLEHLTDTGNKNRLLTAYGDDFLFVPEWGWLQWTTSGWKNIKTNLMGSLAESVPDMIRMEAANHITDPKQQTAWVNYSYRAESAGSISAMLKLAENDRRTLRDVSDFDANSYEIACRNGIVDLRTGEIREYSREDAVTKNTKVLYDPTFELPEWDQFLKESTDGDQQMVKYLQRAAGYTLTGDVSQECFFIISGPTASGKSTFVDAMQNCMGSYSTTLQSEVIMYRRGKDVAKEEIAALAGTRFVGISEIREGASFNEELLKQLTGGDQVRARFLYKDSFTFYPQFKIWIATNHEPTSQDQALVRRIKRIMFMHSIPPHRRDPALKAMLRDPERGGRAVLAWAVRGAMEFLRDGTLEEPNAIRDAVEEYRVENDMFSKFIDECFVRDEAATISIADAYGIYALWCKGNGEHPQRRPQFTQRMKERGVSKQGGFLVGLAKKRMVLTDDGVVWQ